MSVNSSTLFTTIVFLLLLLPELFFAQAIQFTVLGKKNKPIKGASIYFTNIDCGADSIAGFQGGNYQFNCFPEGMIPVHFEAKGYESKTLLIKQKSINSSLTVNLLKKGWQTIKLEDATYKFWKLKNVLYVKEKDPGSIYRLNLLLDSLGLFESPYYGKDFYEHENGQDFSAFDSPILELIRKSEFTLVVAPVILLFRELKDGEKKFQSVNKLLPITNIIEFKDNKLPQEQIIDQFNLEKYWIYSDQIGGNSPFAYQTSSNRTGLCILDILDTIEKGFPDVEPKIFNPGNWYSLNFDQFHTKDELEEIEE